MAHATLGLCFIHSCYACQSLYAYCGHCGRHMHVLWAGMSATSWALTGNGHALYWSLAGCHNCLLQCLSWRISRFKLLDASQQRHTDTSVRIHTFPVTNRLEGEGRRQTILQRKPKHVPKSQGCVADVQLRLVAVGAVQQSEPFFFGALEAHHIDCWQRLFQRLDPALAHARPADVQVSQQRQARADAV